MEDRADINTVAAALAALLVNADGIIDDAELQVAVKLGAKMLPGFSPIVFETLLEGTSDLPSAHELASKLGGLLDDEGKTTIMIYLVALAEADDRVVDVERIQLEEIARGLGIEMPSLSTAQ